MVAVTFDDLLVRCDLARDRFFGGLDQLIFLDPLLVEGGRLQLAPLLQRSYDCLRVPADLVRQTTELAVLAARLQTQHSQGRWNDQALLFVVRRGDPFVHFEALQGFLTPVDLMGKHTSNSSPEDHARGTVVERSACWISVHALLQEIKILQLVSVEVSRDVNAFTSQDDNPLTIEEGLGNDGTEAPQQMGPCIDHEWLRLEPHDPRR